MTEKTFRVRNGWKRGKSLRKKICSWKGAIRGGDAGGKRMGNDVGLKRKCWGGNTILERTVSRAGKNFTSCRANRKRRDWEWERFRIAVSGGSRGPIKRQALPC